MKIFNADQIRIADNITISRQQISSIELMERAAFRVFRRLRDAFLPVEGTVWVFSGIGNNGGDGLVIARYLSDAGYKVRAVIVNFSKHRSADFLLNYDRLLETGVAIDELHEGSVYPVIEEGDLVVDAIFGIGLNREPPAWVAGLIGHLNAAAVKIIAVDVPSGLFMNGMVPDEHAVIKAQHTYTFELPKLVFLLPDTGKFTRSWSVVGIDQDKDFIAAEVTPFFFTEEEEMVAMLRRRERFSHKGSYGHVLVCGGSYGKIGAPLMCAEAALTAGSGLVSALVPRCGYGVFQTAVPEVMCVPVTGVDHLDEIRPDFDPDVFAIGPGLGTHDDTAKALADLLEHYHGKLVLDADALNILAGDPRLWRFLPENAVLTPHPGEFRRLAGAWGSDRGMMEKAMAMASQKGVVLVLKGAYTMVTNGREVYFNSTGNPGMATGGSGDVLTGVIASLLGQGYTAMEAARLGVYIHGLAADIAVRQTSQWALTATDIIDFLGDAFLHLSALKK
ncbi:NAD(P)H-hydrate dehydratase [Robertkochia sediminum]|uniref:NAD(P)H-hydrate dehydratase n=1 Tax=Robertkochia sediminum TaxID=2785326 RepID=UPI001932EB7D|nr:NAD(P)H-hydrate dehydratase [Robertkochia sediminum]MBL7474126.1 NAD(P)H-hydrate dehydratase [Robertkochia sediminum]